MPTLETLPCEIVATILRSLDNVRDLAPCLLSCRHIYSSFKESPGMASELLLRQVTPALLPYSVAVMEASSPPRPNTDLTIARRLLDTLFNAPAQLVHRLQTYPLSAILQLGHLHDLVCDLVADFASDAWSLIPQRSPGASGSVSISPAEYFRFCRAFYRVELYLTLSRSEAGALKDCEHRCFFSRQPPWEIEQLGCVHDFLEKIFSQASFEVLAHDVDFGETPIDYLTLGGYNYSKQQWLAQGLGFIYQIAKEESYEKKRTLLQSGYQTAHVWLYDAICGAWDDATVDDRAFGDYPADEIEALLPPEDAQDFDEGPRLAWSTVHLDEPLCSFMLEDCAGLRECAYVLWDLDRIVHYDMPQVLVAIPDQSSHTYSCGDKMFSEMEESFDERSGIWLKGGSGYWARGDESKIVWSKAE